MSMQQFFYEGRYMSAEQIIALKKGTKKTVIETPSESPKELIKKEVIDSPKEDTQKEVVADELETARTDYLKIFGRKANPNTKLETLLNKIAEANA